MRVFACSQSRWKHEKKTCKINRSEEGLTYLYEYTKRSQEAKDAELAKLRSENAQLRRDLDEARYDGRASMGDLVRAEIQKALSPQGPQTPCRLTAPSEANIVVQGSHAQVDNRKITNIRNEVTNNNLTVNVFGKERIDHISAPFIYRLLMDAKTSAEPAVQALLETALVIFSDPSKPENITCYLPNKKTQEALVHSATGWQIRPVELVLDPMMKRSIDVLFQKQPYGHEEGLPDRPDITSCGEVLKQLSALEQDPQQAKKAAGANGSLKAVLIRNKDELARARGGLPVAGEV